MAAARGNQVEVARYLMERFPYSVPYKNNAGMDLVRPLLNISDCDPHRETSIANICTSQQVMISAQGGAVALLPSLLTQDPMIPLDAVDNEGNTALHYAATEGNLGIIQILLDHGASASIKNKAQWTPIQYSSTMVVELYFTKMVVIAEKRQMDERKRKEKEDESGQASVGGIRIISPDDNIPFPSFPDAGPDDGFEASLWKTNSSRQTTPWRAPTDHAQNKEVSPASSPDGPSQMFFP